MQRVCSQEELALAAIEPAFWKVLTRRGTTLDTRCFTKEPYTALLCSIIGQRIRFDKARDMRARLLSIAPLTQEHIFQMTSEQLHAIIGDREKVALIKRVTEHIVSKQIPLTSAAAIESLKCVKGIGKWTIENTLLTIDPSRDMFPSGDLFLRGRIQRLLELPARPTQRQVADLTSAWSPHRGTATWLLWRWGEATPYQHILDL